MSTTPAIFRPLQGIRVVALEHAVAAPLCTRHLSDLGADVIKVERSGSGDFARNYDDALGGQSAHFTWLNWGKRSITVDPKSEAGRDTLRRLVESADVLVSNLGPGALERLLPERRLANPSLVECAISAFAPSGPNAHRKGYDLLIQAEAGLIRATGTPEQPAKPGVSMADLSSGIYGATAICSALYQRARTGQGASISVSMFDVVTEWMSPLIMIAHATGSAPPPVGLHHPSIAPYGPYETKTGTLVIAVQNEHQWRRLCEEILGDASLADDERFVSNVQRVAHRDELDTVVKDCFAARGRAEIANALINADIPYADLNRPSDVPNHSEIVSRGRWQRVRLSDGFETDVLTSPFHTAPVKGRTVPGLGEHTEEILREIEDFWPADHAVRADHAGDIGDELYQNAKEGGAGESR